MKPLVSILSGANGSFKQAEQMAAALGGRLEVPRLSWKYALD